MRCHTPAITIVALLVAGLTACSPRLVDDGSATTTSTSVVAAPSTEIGTDVEPDGSNESTDVPVTTDPVEPAPTTVPPAPRPTAPTADPTVAFPDGKAADLVLVQDFESPIQLASYTPDGDLAAIYVDEPGEIAWQPIWAPDGRSVAWASTADGAEWSLVIADVDGTRRREHELPGRPDYLTFDPTSARIVSLTPSPQGFGMVVVELDGGDDNGWTLIDAGSPYFSDFAPDGERLVSHVGAEIRIVSLDRPPEPLGFTTTGHQTPVWHPDGDSVIVTEEVDDGATVVQYDLATGTTTEIATFGDFVAFSVDPAGEAIAVSSFAAGDADGPTVDAFRAVPSDRMRNGVWVIELDGGAATQLTDTPTVAPAFAPGGDLILVRDTAAGVGTWTVFDREGTVVSSVETDVNASLLPNYLPFWDQFVRSQTLWSPTGDRFVHVGSDPNDRPGVWIHDVDEDESTFLVDGEIAFWSPT